MDLDKIADGISKLYQVPGLTLKQAYALIARKIALMVLEARIEELDMLRDCDNRGRVDVRIAELKAEIAKLKVDNE